MKQTPIRTSDIDRFLAGDLPEDSLESERIVRDMVDHADGQVWTYLRSLSDERGHRLDSLWERLLGPYTKTSEFKSELESVTSAEAVLKPDLDVMPRGANEDGWPTLMGSEWPVTTSFALKSASESQRSDVLDDHTLFSARLRVVGWWCATNVLLAWAAFELFLDSVPVETASYWGLEAAASCLGIASLVTAAGLIRDLRRIGRALPPSTQWLSAAFQGAAAAIPPSFLVMLLMLALTRGNVLAMWLSGGACVWAGFYVGLSYGSQFIQTFWNTPPTGQQFVRNCVIVILAWVPTAATSLAAELVGHPYGIATARHIMWLHLENATLFLAFSLPGIAIVLPHRPALSQSELRVRVCVTAALGILVAWVLTAGNTLTVSTVLGSGLWFIVIAFSAFSLSFGSESVVDFWHLFSERKHRWLSPITFALLLMASCIAWTHSLLSSTRSPDGMWMPLPSDVLAGAELLMISLFAVQASLIGWYRWWRSKGGLRNKMAITGLAALLALSCSGCGSPTNAVRRDLESIAMELQALDREIDANRQIVDAAGNALKRFGSANHAARDLDERFDASEMKRIQRNREQIATVLADRQRMLAAEQHLCIKIRDSLLRLLGVQQEMLERLEHTGRDQAVAPNGSNNASNIEPLIDAVLSELDVGMKETLDVADLREKLTIRIQALSHEWCEIEELLARVAERQVSVESAAAHRLIRQQSCESLKITLREYESAAKSLKQIQERVTAIITRSAWIIALHRVETDDQATGRTAKLAAIMNRLTNILRAKE
jgi:hypothetical protein